MWAQGNSKLTGHGGRPSGSRKLRPAGLEPATDGLENRCSILLSYGRIARRERHVDGPDTQAQCGSDCARQDLNLRPAV